MKTKDKLIGILLIFILAVSASCQGKDTHTGTNSSDTYMQKLDITYTSLITSA